MTCSPRNIKVLRISGNSSNISANVFEELFRSNIASTFNTDYMVVHRFVELAQGREHFLFELQSYDFICPDYTLMAVVPWLLQLRNQHQLPFGVLFISHSPGVYGLEWFLMRKLVRDRDIIIAPSTFAKRVIALLAPSLEPNIEVLHHPIQVVESIRKKQQGSRIVTLSRIVEDKLIHRQIDAMALVVHKYGYRHLQMHIGGSLHDGETGAMTSYALLLNYKIEQLNLQDHVFLAGEITGRQKVDFFTDAFASVNLSRTIEEAFPKVTIEALGHGVPVIATQWNGFQETVGDAGILLDLEVISPGRVDLEKEELANAIISLYDKPIPDQICKSQIAQYELSKLIDSYGRVIGERSERSAASKTTTQRTIGLLDSITFLHLFSHDELMGYHTEWVDSYLPTLLENKTTMVRTSESFFRVFITEALQGILTEFYAYMIDENDIDNIVSIGSTLSSTRVSGDFRERMRESIYSADNEHSRTTLLKIFSERPDTALMGVAVSHFLETAGEIPHAGYYIPRLEYLRENYQVVCDFYEERFSKQQPELYHADHLCLWAKSARHCCGSPKITRLIREWLSIHSTEPESLPVRLEYILNLIHQLDTPVEIIEDELDILEKLSFDKEYVEKLRSLTYAR